MEDRFGSLRATFRQMDADHSGYVSRRQFESACAAWGLILQDGEEEDEDGDYNQIQSLFPHPDGVNYSEFVTLMTGAAGVATPSAATPPLPPLVAAADLQNNREYQDEYKEEERVREVRRQRLVRFLRTRLVGGEATLRQAFQQKAGASGAGVRVGAGVAKLTQQQIRSLLLSFHIDCSHRELDGFHGVSDSSGGGDSRDGRHFSSSNSSDDCFTYEEFIQLLQDCVLIPKEEKEEEQEEEKSGGGTETGTATR